MGTRLYIAPEVQSARGKSRNHAKADMYSLGVSTLSSSGFMVADSQQIVFFEMNYTFSTGFERIVVLENLRKPDIIFPATWDSLRARQKQSEHAVRLVLINELTVLL